jgi:thiamine pyrophosphokinase
MKIWIALNGECKKETALRLQKECDTVIAADGGVKQLLEWGIVPHIMLGDMDSASDEAEQACRLGAQRILFPPRKNATDGELALDFIKENGGTSVTIYGATGGKIEHILGNIGLLAYADEIGLNAKIIEDRAEIYFVRNELEILDRENYRLSIIPYGGEVKFEESKGLKYSLNGLKILPYSSLGISNEITVGKGLIKVKKGACIVIISKN